MDIDCYETEKECNGQPKECHRLSAQEREDILIKIGGHSRNQIVTAQFEASTDQKWGRAGKGKTPTKEQRLLWEKAQQAELRKEDEVDGEATSP